MFGPQRRAGLAGGLERFKVLGGQHGVDDGLLGRLDRGEVIGVEIIVAEELERLACRSRSRPAGCGLAVEKARKMSPELLPPGVPLPADADGGAAGHALDLMRHHRRVGGDDDDDRAPLALEAAGCRADAGRHGRRSTVSQSRMPWLACTRTPTVWSPSPRREEVPVPPLNS
ncbi:MAG: hypothetical protein V9G11_05575 [Bifidobacterium adolescentis]